MARRHHSPRSVPYLRSVPDVRGRRAADGRAADGAACEPRRAGQLPLMLRFYVRWWWGMACLLVLTGCASVQEVRAHGRFGSEGRHHGAALAGPEVEFVNGVRVRALVGRQFAVWSPGEPHVSSRAPSDETQFWLDGSVPLYRRPSYCWGSAFR